MSKNIQKQVWSITFDADQIPYDRLDDRLKMLAGIVKVEGLPMHQKMQTIIYGVDALQDALIKAKKESKDFLESWEVDLEERDE